MNKGLVTIILLLCFLSFIGCEDELPINDNDQPIENNQQEVNYSITTFDASNVGLFTAVLHGKIDITLDNDDMIGFKLSTDSLFSEELTNLCIVDSIASDSTFSFSIIRGVGYNMDMPSLEPGTKYYARSFMVSRGIEYLGGVISFNTIPIEIITGIIDTISNTIDCKVNLFIDDIWIDGILGVCYSNKPEPTIDDFTISNDNIDIGLQEDGTFSVAIDNLVYGGAFYYRAYYTYSGKTYYGITRSVPMPFKAVDMGFSVKWAICNVGATTESGLGDYYAWGETEPYYKPGHAYDSPISKEFLKEDKQAGYDLSSYFDYDYKKGIIYDQYYGRERYSFYKYNKGFEGDTLELSDDVAHVLWGGEWRMPYSSEWTELNKNSVIYDTIYYGVAGKMYVSKINGNNLFVPASGYRLESRLAQGDKYWSRDFNNSFGSYYGRCSEKAYGLPIRPVQPKSAFVKTNGVALNTEKIELNLNDQYTLKATVIPDNATHSKVLWDTDNHRVATVDEYGNVVAVNAGMCYVTATTQYGSFTSRCLVIVRSTSLYHEAVDLGLSVKWATCNLGADKPEDYGYYYFRGHVSPQINYSHDYYFDAAKENWGGDWRLPTIDEWKELYDEKKCLWFWTELNGVSGYKVQSKITDYVDNWIFLPAAGGQWNSISGVDSSGCYWSSTISKDYSSSIYMYLEFSRYGCSIRESSNSSWSIRPVCP